MADRPKNLTLQETVANSSGRRGKSTDSKSGGAYQWVPRVCLLIVVVASPWMIGSVGLMSQLILSALIVVGIICWWLETSLSSKKKQFVPYLAVFLILGIFLGFLQTLSLSEGFAGLMAGRQVEVNDLIFADAAGETNHSVRLTMDVEGTWHQLRLLVIALSCVLLGCRYFRSTKMLVTFLTVVMANGVALTAFGLLQKFYRPNGKLFWYIDLEQGGAPFASFVCRNNTAGYLVMCVAAGLGLFMVLITKKVQKGKPRTIVSKEIPVWRQLSTYTRMLIEELDARKIAVLACTVFISLGVVASLSRGGCVALLAAFAFGGLVFNMTRKPGFAQFLFVPVIGLVALIALSLGFLDQVFSRFEKIDTLSQQTVNARVKTWEDTIPAAFDHGWFGAGLGSYRSVHRMYRSNPENVVFEYAENQYVQTLVELGIPGTILLGLTILMALIYMFTLLVRGNSGSTVGAGVFASLLLGGQLVAGIFDFGWYIPANMILFATSIGVVAYQAHSLMGRLKKTNWLRFECPSSVIRPLILFMFLMMMLAAADLYRRGTIRSSIGPSLVNRDKILELAEIDQEIETLAPKVRNYPTVRGLNRLADLYTNRARRKYFDTLQIEEPAGFSEEQASDLRNSIWLVTSVPRIHQEVRALEERRDFTGLRKFRSEEFFQVDLRQALAYREASRRLAPLQPLNQIKLSQLVSLVKGKDEASVEMDRATFLSPNNYKFRLFTAIFRLQNGDMDGGIDDLRHLMSVHSRAYRNIFNLVTGRSDRQIPAISNNEIAEEIIVDTPVLLYRFAVDYLAPEDPYRMTVLRKANEQMVDISLSDSESLELKANINFALGESDEGIDFLRKMVRSNPDDRRARYRLAKTLLEHGFVSDSEDEIERLIKIDRSNQSYQNLFKRIKRKVREMEKSSAAHIHEFEDDYFREPKRWDDRNVALNGGLV